jgi:hypothetical protein
VDDRLLSVVFLLMAGVLPIRSLTENWADDPRRRGARRLVWIVYALVAVLAVGALVYMGRSEGPGFPPRPMDGTERLVRCDPPCVGGPARA